jgi:RNA polymerase sigma factor (sigma-70 family)
MSTMAPTGTGDSIQTRPSLLARLQSGDDRESWQEFYRIYGGLIRSFALKAGLTEAEADEVVQETAIGVARHLPDYHYDPEVCSFKTWLLNLTTWRIKNQLRKRARYFPSAAAPAAGECSREEPGRSDETGRTGTIERVADPAVPEFGAEWDAAWEKRLFQTALEQVKDQVDGKAYQIFDLYVVKEWPAREVAHRMGISVARVYLTKHRLSALLKKEIQKMDARF